MKKLIFIGILCSGLFSAIHAQQLPQYTMYMTNPYLLNPAVAGTHNYYQIISNHRFQWVGLTDPPNTNVLSIFGPMVNQPMGLGGHVMYDIAGPTSKVSLYGSYAYYYTINEEYKVSMGLNLGFMQYKIDGTKITTENDDPALNDQVYSFIVPDATIGAYFYSSTLHVGFTAAQLINNKLKFGEEQPTGLSKLKSHFYLTAGYKYYINREFAVEPTLIVKKVAPAPFQLDFNVRGFYKNMLWAGISYRTQDAVSILLGYIYEQKIYIGYSYDIGITPIRKFNSGSHELMIGYRFSPIKEY
ncbi:MAG: type IX secretion system membrane protein PorP/SprF [Bacteroidales bacterium]|nr:type IX secretion system membrane protein PorP/SprF [Bacteroidales bacterium]